RANWIVSWQGGYNTGFLPVGIALRMSKSIGGIVNHVVIVSRTNATRHIVEVQFVPQFPGDNVVGATCVTTYAESSDQLALCIVQRQSTAKYIDATDLLTNQWVIGLAVIFRRTFVSSLGLHGIAMLQTIKRSARLHSRVEIGC